MVNGQEVNVSFNQKGQVRGNLPTKLITESKLVFNIDGKDLAAEEQKIILNRIKESSGRIEKLKKDPEKLHVLKLIYNIDSNDLNKVLADFDKLSKSPTTTGYTYVPSIGVNSNYYKIESGDTKDSGISLKANNPTIFSQKLELQHTDQNSLTFTLTKTNLFNDVTYQWYADKRKIFKKSIIQADGERLKDLAEKSKLLLVNFDVLVKAVKNNTISNMVELRKFDQQLTVLLNVLAEVKKLTDFSSDREWVLSWLWYSKNDFPVLNPFPFVKEEDIELPDTLGLPALRMSILAKENFLKNIDYKKTPERVAQQYIKEIAASNLDLSKQIKAYKKSKDRQSNNENQISDFSTTEETLNKLILIASKKGEQIFWMRHHNALDQGADLNSNTEAEYTEADRVYILTHNLVANQKAIISLKYSPILNDQSQFADLITSTLKGLDGVTANTFGGRKEDEERVNLAAQVNRKISKVQAALPYLLSIDYVVNQTSPKLDVEEIKNTSEIYHSQKDKTPVTSGSQQAVYTVTTATNDVADNKTAPSIPVDTFKYRVNKLYRIFPMAGIAYTFNNFGSISPNGAQNGSGLVTTEKKTNFFVGLKVYLNKIDIRNTDFIAQKDAHGHPLFWTRVHLDAAFDLVKPLNNIYTGAGIDPWPGISINFGAVWNKYDYYTYSGGVQNSHQTLYRPGFYLGISTDVAVIAQLTKLLNLSK